MTPREIISLHSRGLAMSARSMSLFRFVPSSDLQRSSSPDYLFTSGNPGRFNPKGVLAFYASEDAATAGAEFDLRCAQLGKRCEQVVYAVEATAPLLDLADRKARAAVNLSDKSLFDSWILAATPTPTQQLGAAVGGQSRVGGIRYPSYAAKKRGFDGFNVVLFKKSIIAPSSVSVFDAQGKLLQSWP